MRPALIGSSHTRAVVVLLVALSAVHTGCVDLKEVRQRVISIAVTLGGAIVSMNPGAIAGALGSVATAVKPAA